MCELGDLDRWIQGAQGESAAGAAWCFPCAKRTSRCVCGSLGLECRLPVAMSVVPGEVSANCQRRILSKNTQNQQASRQTRSAGPTSAAKGGARSTVQSQTPGREPVALPGAEGDPLRRRWNWERVAAIATVVGVVVALGGAVLAFSTLSRETARWQESGPVMKVAVGTDGYNANTNLSLDFSSGSAEIASTDHGPVDSTYVLSNAGRTDAVVLAISVLSAEGDVIVRETCVPGGFPLTVQAGTSVPVVTRTKAPGGAFYAKGTLRVLFSSGLSQNAQPITLDRPEDGQILRDHYADDFEAVLSSCAVSELG